MLLVAALVFLVAGLVFRELRSRAGKLGRARDLRRRAGDFRSTAEEAEQSRRAQEKSRRV